MTRLGVAALLLLVGCVRTYTVRLVESPAIHPAVCFDPTPRDTARLASLNGAMLRNYELQRDPRSRDPHTNDVWWNSHEEIPWGGLPEPIFPRVWHRVREHPYLAKVLPGVEFYVVEVTRGADWYFDHEGFFPRRAFDERLVAISRGRCYLMPDELNPLMYRLGKRFTLDAARSHLHIYSLLVASQLRGLLLSREDADDDDRYWGLPAFPETTVDSAIACARPPPGRYEQPVHWVEWSLRVGPELHVDAHLAMDITGCSVERSLYSGRELSCDRPSVQEFHRQWLDMPASRSRWEDE